MKKLKITKLIASSLIVISVLGLNPIGASASWKQNSTGWWYTEGSSWATGWRQIDGKWYYFDTDGYMAKNTKIGTYQLGADGAWVVTTPIVSTTTTNSETSLTVTGTIILDNVGELNPIRPNDAWKYDSTKMTIFFNKNTGKIDGISSGIADLSGYNKRSDKDLYNYVVVDFNQNILFNPENLYVENGKLVKK